MNRNDDEREEGKRGVLRNELVKQRSEPPKIPKGF